MSLSVGRNLPIEEILSKAECVFAAIWGNSAEAVSTEVIALYYEISTEAVLDTLQTHFEEFNLQNDEWSARDAIRLGFLIDSPIAAQVRTLALDLVEAHKNKDKRASVAFLLQNAEVVQWSNREIARIANCSHTVVNQVRKDLESQNKVVKFEKRKFARGGDTFKQTTTREQQFQPPSGNNFPDAPQKATSFVEVSTPEVEVTSSSHYRYGQKGIIDGESPNNWQQFVKFADGSRELIAARDLDASSAPVQRKFPPEYQEAIAQLEQQHQAEIQQLEEQIRLGVKSEAEALAQESVKERLTALEAIASQKSEEVVQLQQKVVGLESLRFLETENQLLNKRIGELEKALADAASPQNQNHVFTGPAEKVLNAQTTQLLEKVESLEPELHLRILAQDTPTNQKEALLLIGRSLLNFDSRDNKTQKAAALILGCEPEQLTEKVSQLEQLPEAIASIKQSKTWAEVQAVGDRFPLIKQEVWLELSAAERSAITQMKKSTQSFGGFHVGDRVSGNELYTTRYNEKGTVTGFREDGAILVHWDGKAQLLQHNYEPSELRFAELTQE